MKTGMTWPDRILAGLLLVLAASLATALGLPVAPPATLPQTAPATAQAGVQAANRPDRGNRDAMVATVLARPLFRPDRTPIAAGDKAAPEEDTKTVAGRAGFEQGGLPRLTGVIISRHTRAALFETGPQTNKSVPLGGRIGGWTVKDIQRNSVTLERGTTRRTLNLVDTDKGSETS
ncbi:hypothetical protein [Eilatimonas milleporae]|uniref:General secretion pathway protein N n=1 Tax=Eilatimonas milleporae TaxID=911205 RepID=A0A3M0CWI8_9PROT|nr:hypothetical protein [Eilatimonas milleporae]RMB08163.1 general secretion pathway protein N [Eilatimonas milleporae]